MSIDVSPLSASVHIGFRSLLSIVAPMSFVILHPAGSSSGENHVPHTLPHSPIGFEILFITKGIDPPVVDVVRVLGPLLFPCATLAPINQ